MNNILETYITNFVMDVYLGIPIFQHINNNLETLRFLVYLDDNNGEGFMEDVMQIISQKLPGSYELYHDTYNNSLNFIVDEIIRQFPPPLPEPDSDSEDELMDFLELSPDVE